MADSEVIATGALSGTGVNGTGTLVITDGDRHRRGRKHDIELMEAIKDTHAGLERSVGAARADAVCAVKDAEAALQASVGEYYAGTLGTVKDAESRVLQVASEGHCDTVKTVKDAEAQLDRAAGNRFAHTVENIKDAEAQLDRAAGDRFAQTVRDIKDAEAQLDRAGSDRFIQTIQGVKDAESRLSDRLCRGFDVAGRDACDIRREVAGSREHTSEVVRDRASVLEREMHVLGDRIDRDVLINREKNAEWFGRTFEKLCEGREQTLLGFKDTQANSFRLAAEAEKTACNNQMQTLLQFKDQQHLSDRLAAAQALLSERLACQTSKELAAGFCDLKERVHADGALTRAMIGNQEIDRLRERATKAESALNAYFSAKVAPVTPM